MGNFRRKLSSFFEYDTPSMAHIKSYQIGVTHRVLQTSILSYIIGYVIYYQKGYQITSHLSSAVTTKVKGVTLTNVSINLLDVPVAYSYIYNRIWDPVDYVIPTSSGEYGGFFITTNIIVTTNQSRGVCAETHAISAANCKSDADCPAGKSIQIGNGVNTGRCIMSAKPPYTTCEILAWCPVEFDEPPILEKQPLLENAGDFTVLVKNVIEFPLFGHKYKRRNIFESSDSNYLRTCIYNEEKDPYCPIFRIRDIIEAAGEKFSEVAVKGAVFAIQINWDCDLDWDFEKYCKPKYSFERMDSPKEKISPGLNFRTAEYHEENRRTLYKHFGIKFLIQVHGQAGMFNAVPFLVHLGSGLGLLNLANFFCNFLVRHCLKNCNKLERHYNGHQKAADTILEEHQQEAGGNGDNRKESSTTNIASTENIVQEQHSNVTVESNNETNKSCIACMR